MRTAAASMPRRLPALLGALTVLTVATLHVASARAAEREPTPSRTCVATSAASTCVDGVMSLSSAARALPAAKAEARPATAPRTAKPRAQPDTEREIWRHHGVG
jgi:hypothetical protein